MSVSMTLVVNNPHMKVDVDPQKHRVTVTRTSQKFASLDEVHAAMSEVVTATEALDRAGMTLLLDLRSGPMRNDPAFEEAMAIYRQRTERGYRRAAFLVRSAVGELQLQRLAQELSGAVHVTRDEADAHRWLDG
jgi:hypothetical protein